MHTTFSRSRRNRISRVGTPANQAKVRCLLLTGITLLGFGTGGCPAPKSENDDDFLPGSVPQIEVYPSSVTASHLDTVTVEVDVFRLPEGEEFTAYAIDLSEEATGIDIQTGPCPPDTGTEYCEIWSITPGIDTVPSSYGVRITAVAPTVEILAYTLSIYVPPPGGRTAASPASAIAAGADHSLAVLTDGSIWAWGDNEFGQLGNGTQLDAFVPLAISSPPAKVVAGGKEHSLALLQDGTVMAWGNNEDGQLGIGTAGALEDSPRRVCVSDDGLCDDLTGVRAIAAGATHSLALLEDGTARIWGEKVGYIHAARPDGLVECDRMFWVDKRAAETVPNLNGVVEGVAAGKGFSLFLMSDSTVWVWGEADEHHIEIPAIFHRTSCELAQRTPAQVSGIDDVVAIAAGHHHALALRADGTVWSWGSNTAGQLGNGTTTDRDFPGPVANLTDVLAIAASLAHSLALRSDGTVWTWGSPQHEGFGDPRPNGPLTPTRVEGLAEVQAIAAGHTHSLALLTDCGAGGGIKAWGSGFLGSIDPRDPTGLYTVAGIGDLGDCADEDGDGVHDRSDNCPSASNAEQLDADSDGLGTVCDNCPNRRNPDQVESDGDEIGDACDNCPEVANSDQSDVDDDGIGDACDSTGACCNPRTGGCADTSQSRCEARNHVFQGIGLACEPNPCPQPGACCSESTGTCTDGVMEADCQGDGFRWTEGTLCDELSPACLSDVGTITGACCWSGTCAEVNQSECYRSVGLWMGLGLTCSPNPCP